MKEFNEIGISRQLDWQRIRKLLAIGLFASVLHLIGDLILGWGIQDESYDGILRMLSAYIGTSDGGILAAALLGMFGVTRASCYPGSQSHNSLWSAHTFRQPLSSLLQ